MSSAQHIAPSSLGGRTVTAPHAAPGSTPGRQIGSGPAAAVKAVAAKKSAAPKTSSTSASAPAAAGQAAVQKYTGAYSGALNNVSDQEQRARDVATRRQADAQAYSAYVMGSQGKIAAAAQAADQQNVANNVAVQGATMGSQLKLQQQLQSQRDVEGGAGVGGAPGSPNYNAGRSGAGSGLGVGPGAGGQVVSTAGPIPSQQLQGLVSDQQLTQGLLGAGAARQAAQANTNQGKAGFLQAAALANLTANQRAIAGDAFNQQTQLGAQKTDLLARRTDSNKADKRAAAATAAAQASADLAHQDRMASLDQALQIAGDNRANSNAQLDARLTNSNQQGHLNRVVRLKTAATTAAAGGYVTPTEQRRRNTAVSGANDALHKQLTNLRQYMDSPTGKANLHKPGFVNLVMQDVKGAPPAVNDYARAIALNDPKAKARAKTAYDAYVKALANGTLAK